MKVSFTRGVDIATGTLPGAIAIGDFNKDGTLDAAVSDSGSDSVSLLFGDGTGGFRTLPAYVLKGDVIAPFAGSDPKDIAATDFNQDGYLDLAVKNSTSKTISILLGNGTSFFSTKAAIPAGAGSAYRTLATGDFNNDGRVDLVTIDPVEKMAISTVSVLLSKGDGMFTVNTRSVGWRSGAAAVATGDVNNDGKLDLVVRNAGFSSTDSSSNTETGFSVLLGNGAGGFSTDTFRAYNYGPGGTLLADFNQDSKLDLFINNALLLGNGDGTFATSASGFAGADDNAIGDFDGDGC